MQQSDATSEDYIKIAEKVRTGEYFREARSMADLELHDPIADRYWYVLLTLCSLLTVYIAFSAVQSLYPLKPSVPFIYGTNDVVDELPRMRSLLSQQGEDINVALRRFLVLNYVKTREEYNIATFDRNQNALQALSTKEVFQQYEDYIEPSNPKSPILLYQRSITRDVQLLSAQPVETKDAKSFAMRVFYAEILTPAPKEKSPARYQVDIAFQYEPIKLDEAGGKVKPYGFIVTGYQSKRL